MEPRKPPPPSPRALIVLGIAPDRLVVGLRPEQGWVTAAEGPAHEDASFVPLPYLDGVLITEDPAAPQSVADFGRLANRPAAARLRPGSTQDVAGFLRFSAAHGIQVAARGQGHSVFGQSQVENGVQIDMRLCDRILRVGDSWVEVEAGATWRNVLQATLTHGQTPPVMPDYLGLTVGGTLSVGGINGSSWQFGAQVDNVESLTVATGTGDVLSCSDTENADLFQAVLAGQGQCGIILKARLRLIPAPASVRVFDLVYPVVDAAISDLRRIVDEGRFEFAQILIIPSPGGWVTVLEGVSWGDGDSTPGDEDLLTGLTFIREALQVVEQSYFDFANRVVPQMGDIAAVGLGDLPHPWIDLLIPGSAAEQFVGELVAALSPADLGRSFPVLVYPFKRSTLGRALFRAPEDEFFVSFDILRTASPGASGTEQMVEDNRRLFEQNRELGGTHYPIGAIELSPADWERYYGSAWDGFRAAKHRYDPNNILTPGPGIFPS